MRIGIRDEIGDWGSEMRLGNGMEFGIEERDQNRRLRFGFGIRIGNRDWGWGLGIQIGFVIVKLIFFMSIRIRVLDFHFLEY